MNSTKRKVKVCTIVAGNYLAQAKVFAKSFFKYHESPVVVLVVDDSDYPSSEFMEVVGTKDLSIEKDDLDFMKMAYNVSELCTALKPWLLSHILENCPRAVYIDPDTMCFDALTPLMEAMEDPRVLVNPHCLKPFPLDGKRPNDRDIMLSGIYNLGLVGVSNEAHEFLEFWKSRLKRDCIEDVEHGVFVDQRWVDFAPSMFPVQIFKNQSINVAYWNLHDRKLEMQGGKFTVNGESLKLFHFSGFDPNRPDLLNRYFSDNPRFSPEGDLVLRELLTNYTTELEKENFSEHIKQPYGYSAVGNIPLLKFMRKMWRSDYLKAESEHSKFPPNPFAGNSVSDFLSYFNAPVYQEDSGVIAAQKRQGVILTKYALSLWLNRDDLFETFGKKIGSVDSFLNWFRQNYVNEYGFDEFYKAAVNDAVATVKKKGRNVAIAIPFYQNPHLVKLHADYVENNEAELKGLEVKYFIVNDSPEDSSLAIALDDFVMNLKKADFEVEYFINERNLGFIKSANLLMKRAVEQGYDVLLQNSDAQLFGSSLSELQEVLNLDEHFGFVSPRSNNATISSIYRTATRPIDTDKAIEVFKDAKRYLPRYYLSPVANGFCVLIKNEVLKECGYFDEIYGRGYNEENDLMMRANLLGYRALIANYAYATHISSASFGKERKRIDSLNSRILHKRYPYYESSIRRYERSPEACFDRLLTQYLVDRNRPTMLLDLNFLEPYHCGTFEQATKLVKHMVDIYKSSDQVELFYSGDIKALRFHNLNDLGITWLPHINYELETFMFHLRLAQYSNHSEFLNFWPSAMVNAGYFLDAINMDCLYLAHNSPDIFPLWNFQAEYCPVLFFPSNDSRQKFYKRFNRTYKTYDFHLHHSLDLKDYRAPESVTREDLPTQLKDEQFVLVLGNHFKHKRIQPTLENLKDFGGGVKFVALGSRNLVQGNTIILRSGALPGKLVDALYKYCSALVFPTKYEGFGFPTVRALANNKPLIVSDLEVVREIIDALDLEEESKKHITLVPPGGDIKKALSQALLSKDNVEYVQRSIRLNWHGAAKILVENLLKTVGDDSVIELKRASLNTWQKMFNQFSAHEPALRHRIAELENSTSWRVTKPLRMASELVRKLR